MATNTLTLKVDSFDKTNVAWEETPPLDTLAYLDEIDYPNKYIKGSDNGEEEGWFGFENSAVTDAIKEVRIVLYGRRLCSLARALDIRISDGETIKEYPQEISFDEDWGWKSLITLHLDTWDKINNAKLAVKMATISNIENCNVDGLGSERPEWTRVGTSPYLHLLTDSNYVYSTSDDEEIGDFTFEDYSSITCRTLNNVKLYVRTKQEAGGNDEVLVYIWDGNTWHLVATIVPTDSWATTNYDISAILDVWSKVQGAKMYLSHNKVGGVNDVYVSYAYLKVEAVANSEIEIDAAKIEVDYFENGQKTEKDPTNNSGDWLYPEFAYGLVPDNKCAYTSNAVLHEFFEYGFDIPPSTIQQVLIKPNHCQNAGDLIVRVSWDGGETYSAAATVLNSCVEGCLSTAWDYLDATNLTEWTPEKLDDEHFRILIQNILGGTCFAEGSKVRMSDGTRKNIEDIKVGDKIKSWRPNEGKVTGKVLIINTHEHLIGWKIFRVKAANGEPLKISPKHDVAVTAEHTFKPSQNLRVGDSLLDENDNLVKIVKIEKIMVKKLFNIQIDKKTLYVNGWLVHNAQKTPW